MSIGKRYKFNGSIFQVETARATSKKVTAITVANPAVFTATTHGLAIGDTVYLDVEDGMPELAAGEYVVKTVPSANTFTLYNGSTRSVDSSAYAAFDAGSPSDNAVSKVTYTNFCELTGYNQQGGQADTIDATTICSTAKEFETGLADTGTLTLDYNAAPQQPVQLAIEAAGESGESLAFRLVFPRSGGTVIMFGSVQSTSLSGSNGDLHKANATIKLSGPVVRIAA
jgi:hypothetical protein